MDISNEIVSIDYDPGTISSPAFIDILLKDGRLVTRSGRAARRLSNLKKGDTYND